MQILIPGALVALVGLAQAQVGGYGQCMQSSSLKTYHNTEN
jgi:hypothetical protein